MSENKSKARRFMKGTAVLVASLTGGIVANTAGAVASPGVSGSSVQPQTEFVVSPATQVPSASQYQHESHSSHASHASHSSHSSHYSSAG